MDDETTQGVLAHMAYRIVGSRRRELAETVALRIFRRDGSVTAEQVAAQLEAEWVEPDPAEVANLVARKAQAAVQFHAAEVGREAERIANQRAKAADLAAQAEAAAALADELEAEYADSPASARQADAQALFDAAVAAGADPGLAPNGQDVQANAQVAEAVGVATSGRG